MKKMIQQCSQWILAFYRKKGPQNFIYFESFHGKHYSDNPRAIYEELNKEYPDLPCIWGVKKGFEQPFIEAGVPFVYRFSKDWFQALAQAKVWVINNRTKYWLKKSPFTLYIQTWHGTPLKKIGLDIPEVTMPNITTDDYRTSILQDTKDWDIVLSPSTYTSEKLSSAFSLKQEQILPSGYPKNDFLVALKEKKDWALQKVEAIKQTLHLPLDKKIVLYAPTWRDHCSDEKGNYQFKVPFSLEEWEKEFGEEYILLIRLHYLVTPTEDFHTFSSVRDVSSYEEMSELLAISDLLITDYSSCLFDYALLERPQIYYMYDQEEYEHSTRGMYFSPKKELPGVVVHDEKSLWEQLKKEGSIDLTRYQNFLACYANYEKGTAAKQVINVIINHIEK